MNDNKKSLVVKVAVFLFFLLTGIFFYSQTLANYQIKSYTATGIIAGKYPYHDEMNVNSFTMDIDTQKNVIVLSSDIVYYSEGNYSILLTLPYRIASYQNQSSGNWNIKNAESGSVVMATFKAENVSESGWGHNTFCVKLYTQDSILDTIFETRSISLPFGGSITLDIQEKMDELREITPFTILSGGFNGSVRIGIPYSAIITGTTLQVNRRDPAKELQVLEFQITEFKPFQLQYVDSTIRAEFERNLLMSGVLLGVAASGFAGIIIETLTSKYQKRDAKEHNNTTNSTNHSETMEKKAIHGEKKRALRIVYKNFHDENWQRGQNIWVVNSILITGSLIVAFQPTFEKLTPVVSLVLVVIAAILQATGDKVTAITYKEMEKIGNLIGIVEPKEMYESEIKGKWWCVVRRSAPYLLFDFLIATYLLLMFHIPLLSVTMFLIIFNIIVVTEARALC